jgi:superfamily I DNA/RNA helicase
MNHLAVYDKAWDAIFTLPREVQKRLPEFIQKFRENSKGHSIHLEPISTFADPQLRTARITQKYRAIIRAPKSGNTYHLLHIGNHDEAMDWASRKVFDWNENTQSYQVYTIPPAEEVVQPKPEDGTEKTINVAFPQTDKELLAIGVPEILLPSVRQVTDANGLEALYDYLPIEALENLSMLLEGSEYDTILREVEAGKSSAETQDEKEQSANNQRSFFELTDDDLLNEMLAGKVAKWRIFLHPSQRKIVEGNYRGPIKVTGGAGTGKTVAALHRVKKLQDQGTATRTQPILFTTYTRALSKNLAKELKAVGCEEGIVHLNNIDAFVVEAAKENGLSQGGKILDLPGSKSAVELWREVTDFMVTAFSPDFLHEEYQEVILYQDVKDKASYFTTSRRGRRRRLNRKDRMVVWDLVKAYEVEKEKQGYQDLMELYNKLTEYFNTLEIKPFSHVIADEIQDFSNVHLRLLRSLVEEKSNDLFMVGDPLQKIYNRRIVFSQAGINIRGARSRRLKINYRTTEKIRQAAVNVIEGIEFSDFEEGVEPITGYVSLRTGVAPTYEVYSTREEEVSALVERVKSFLPGQPGASSGLSLPDICVATRQRSAMKDFRKELHRANIPYYDLTEGRVPTGNFEVGIRLSTFHNLKGLEFKVVFLADLSQSSFPFRPVAYRSWPESEQVAHDERERALLYVAITRAVIETHLSGVGQKF